MKKTSEPILFFGSGPVAAKSLEFLYENFNVQAVITKPAPSHHRGEVPVVKFAQDKLLKTYFVRDKLELNNLFLDKNVLKNIRLGVLVDFGIIVSKSVIDCFELGIVNSHFSLLPEWRGADPITFAILSGQEETGVSLMVIVEAMDEGPLLAQQPYKLMPNITTLELTEALIKLSNSTLSSTLPAYMAGKVQPVAQDTTVYPTYSRKLTKDDGDIDWKKSAKEIEREIRAFAGWPRSHAVINGVPVIVTRARVINNVTGEPGTVETRDKQLVVHSGDQSLIIEYLKPAGKTEMSGPDFLRGYPIK